MRLFAKILCFFFLGRFELALLLNGSGACISNGDLISIAQQQQSTQLKTFLYLAKQNDLKMQIMHWSEHRNGNNNEICLEKAKAHKPKSHLIM